MEPVKGLNYQGEGFLPFYYFQLVQVIVAINRLILCVISLKECASSYVSSVVLCYDIFIVLKAPVDLIVSDNLVKYLHFFLVK